MTVVELRIFLVTHYDQLKDQLGRKLGSGCQANDVLHDVYVRLEGKSIAEPVLNPRAFILRMAHNLVVDGWRRDSRQLSSDEIDELLDLDAPDLGPQQYWEDGLQLDSLISVIQNLSPRRRDILLAVRLDGISTRELAKRYGISQRMVEKELRWAHEYCANRLSR